LGTLLLVVTIEGIMPDAHDLASMQPLRLLAQALLGSSTLGQDDEWPDDVCDPVTSSAVSRHACYRMVRAHTNNCGAKAVQSQKELNNLLYSSVRALPAFFSSFARPLCALGCLLC
jgi:hypothetical protein